MGKGVLSLRFAGFRLHRKTGSGSDKRLGPRPYPPFFLVPVKMFIDWAYYCVFPPVVFRTFCFCRWTCWQAYALEAGHETKNPCRLGNAPMED